MKITVVGKGRVGGQLATALAEAGHSVNAVSGHRFMDGEETLTDSELTIVSVADMVLEDVVREVVRIRREMGCETTMTVAHTAGSIAIGVFGATGNYGIFYPMQTFSKERKVEFAHLPIFIEADGEATKERLWAVAQTLTDHVSYLTSEQRKKLHIAAVFACNFVNHCLAIADDLLHEIGTDYHAVLPLVEETISKLHTMTPREAQTGPARRGDTNVMAEHVQMIEDEAVRKIYRLMSESINR
ncbi:MAG: DUF2520 domain-containing protein [Bacteroidaceae bacterium]|nr:DUF2520 domain-containing protein [Bacteroidaceae bacterium]